MAVRGRNQQLATMPDRFSFMRTGIVAGQVDPFGATVDVGGTMMRAAYVRQSPPVAGDTVVVMRQAATWLIVGTTSASGANSVQNPSFEELDPVSSDPVNWTLYNITNTSSLDAVPSPEAIEGVNVLEVVPTDALTGTSYVYSAPIGVVPGDVWQLSAYANGFYPSTDAVTSDASLYALWFTLPTDLYPTTASADTLIQTATNLPENDLMTLLSGNVTVPGAATFMRVGLRSVVSAGAGLHYDFVGARLQP